MLVASCGDTAESTTVSDPAEPAAEVTAPVDSVVDRRAELVPARSRWEANAPAEYSFRSFVECLCETDAPLQAVDVRDGEVTTAFGPLLALSTVDDWFDFLADEVDGQMNLDVTFDPDLGFPTSVRFDDPTAEDDGFEMTGGTVTALLPVRDDRESIDPETIPWLVLPDGVDGLDLVESERFLDAECGAMTSCDPYLPSARLRYESTDGTTSITIVQRFPARRVPVEPVRGDVSGLDVDQRRFVIGVDRIRSELSKVEVTSNGPDGSVVRIDAVGIEVDVVEFVIRGLVAAESGEWPQIDRARRTLDEIAAARGRCVGDDTRVAPLVEPEGHTRFVLDAAPDGSCPTGPFMWASYANPDDDRPLTNVFVEPAIDLGNVTGTETMIAGYDAVVGASGGGTIASSTV